MAGYSVGTYIAGILQWLNFRKYLLYLITKKCSLYKEVLCCHRYINVSENGLKNLYQNDFSETKFQCPPKGFCDGFLTF
jgi:hypothetical protein